MSRTVATLIAIAVGGLAVWDGVQRGIDRGFRSLDGARVLP